MLLVGGSETAWGKPAIAGGKDARAAKESAMEIASPQEMFGLLGVEPAIWEQLRNEENKETGDAEVALLRVLYALRRFQAQDVARWAERSWNGTEIGKDLGAAQGDLLQITGKLVEIEAVDLPAELAARFEMPRYFRGQVECAENRGRVTIWVREVPRAWKMGAVAEPVSAVGALLGADGDGALVLAADRLAWHPDTPLGRLGMDVGLLDDVTQRAPLKERERDAFYQLLAAAGSLEDPPGSHEPNSVVPLFNDPAGQVGRLVELAGIARRAIRVPIADKEVRRRLGIDHYFELEIFTPDSQGNPLVCCVRELPPDMPEGDQIAENVWLWAVFLKVWSFETRGEAVANSPGGPRQLAPLLVGRTVHWMHDPLKDPSSLAGWMGMTALAIVLAVVGVVSWRLARSDRRERQTIARLEETPVDWTRIERETPDGEGGSGG
jgi:hypothetical protein